MAKSIEELEEIVKNSSVILPLDFVIRTMKVMEIAQECINEHNNHEQKELIGNYSNTLFHEVSNFITSEELEDVEDNEILEEL